MEQAVYHAYAKALYEKVRESCNQETIFSDVQKLQKALNASVDAQKFIQFPLSTTIQKEDFCQTLTTKLSLSSALHDFLLFLSAQKRFNALLSVLQAYINYHKAQNDIQDIYVTTGHDLSPDEAENITHIFGAHHIYHWAKNPTVLAGFTARIKDQIYDYSLQNQLSKLTSTLQEFS
jgi:ATP synthase F1 delta subunit